jgi:endoglucanase
MRKERTSTGSLVTAALLACGLAMAAPVAADDTHTDTDTVPPAASPFWVNPDSRAARQAEAWEARGKQQDAALLRRIADQPMATWVGDRDPEDEVRRITTAAAYQDRIPVIAAYDIPHRDCGYYSAGGAHSAYGYRRWIRHLAAGIQDRKALVILEPDAVAQLVTGCAGAELEGNRLELIGEAVKTLKALPRTKVYLDAGNAGWIPDQRKLVEALWQAGVRDADGFALNVSNFQTTQVSKVYGDKLSAQLGGVHYVIDTSRNGNGPWLAPNDAETWCNPPNRALGQAPTTATGSALVDAYLWVKRPGESDGSCRGAPPAGEWWSSYALELARASVTLPGSLFNPAAQ